MGKQEVNFIRPVDDAGIILAGANYQCNLEALKQEFGGNFNTLQITNNSSQELVIKLNGRDMAYLNGSGASMGFDWEDGIIFDDLQIKNNDVAGDTSANQIRISVGRTGQ